MGRQPCCDKVGLKKGPWTTEEDEKLVNFILNNGQHCWRLVPKLAGLLRCGKSCRLRWTNYLRPDLKRGVLSEVEEKLVIELHARLGNRWSKIASHLPGRTDNEIKNHWNTHIKKKLRKMGIDPITHKSICDSHECQETNLKQKHFLNGVQADILKPIIEDEKESQSEIHTENTDSYLSKYIDFCTNEIPLIQDCEILVTCATSSSSTLSSTISAKPEEFIFCDLGWPEPNDTYLWGIEDFGYFDMIYNDKDMKLYTDPENQQQRLILDQDQWKMELF